MLMSEPMLNVFAGAQLGAVIVAEITGEESAISWGTTPMTGLGGRSTGGRPVLVVDPVCATATTASKPTINTGIIGCFITFPLQFTNALDPSLYPMLLTCAAFRTAVSLSPSIIGTSASDSATKRCAGHPIRVSKPMEKRFFFEKYGLSERDLERYLSAALGAGGEYADLYF